MHWSYALLIESPTQDCGVKASYQARLVLASLFYHEKFSFSGNLNQVALEVGLTSSFFRIGVKDLIDLDWLTGEPNDSINLGPPSKSFRISKNLQSITTPKPNVESWQLQIVETLLFPKGGRLKNRRVDVVLAVLILSSNEAGFVCNLSQAEIADRCGIAKGGVKRFLSQLQDVGSIVQFPGGGGKKIAGSGWLVSTVYQIRLNKLRELIGLNIGQSMLLNNDYFENFYREAGLFKVWPTFIKDAVPQSTEYKLFMEVFTSQLKGGFSEAITTNLISRLLSAASYLLSNKNYQSVFKRLRDKAKSPPTLKEQGSMVGSLLQNKSTGIQLGLDDRDYNYQELIDDFQSVLEKKRVIEKAKAKRAEDVLKEEVPLEKLPKYDPLPLISLCLSFLAIRFVTSFYSQNYVLLEEREVEKEQEQEQEQEGICILHWLPDSDGIHYVFIKSK